MAKLNELLGDKYKDGLTTEELTAAIEGLTLFDADSDAFKTAYIERTTYEKAKKSFDGTASELAALKKEKQGTATREQELIDRLTALEKEKTRTDFERRLAKGGFDEEAIKGISEAMDDPVELAEKLSAYTRQSLETAKKNAVAEILKKHPEPPAGTPGDGGVMTKERFAKLSLPEKQAFFTTNPEQYKKLAQN
jgi:hypothetical protein